MSDHKSSEIELCLFAPYNDEVKLTASWNKWQHQPMTKGSDGWWRLTANLPDGTHQYKFVVKSKSYFALDQYLEVFDPYAISITNDHNENAILRVKDGKRVWTDYQWHHDQKPLPTNEQLIIYELHVGDFTGGMRDEKGPRKKGTFAATTEKLDYLRDLGITAVELMPVKEFPGKSWGYNLRSLFAVDSGYGSPEELCRLIDESHARGMRVFVDGVYNHAEADSPLAKIDYEYWFHRNNPDPANMQWGPKYDYDHYDSNLKLFPARKYVIESIMFWVEHFHIDGIRFDATRALAKFDILREFTDAAFKKVGKLKPFFTVAEHIPEDPAITGYPKGPMIAAWHEQLANQLRATAMQREYQGAQPGNLEALAQRLNPATNGYGSGNHVVNFLGNHDHKRILRDIADTVHIFDDAAFRRVKLALGLLLTSPGIPMIWMGQEFGAANPLTMDPQPIDWNLLANKNNKDLHAFTTKLIKFRREDPALWNDNFQVVLADTDRQLFAYKRWNDAGGLVVVITNLKDTPSGEFTIEKAGLEDGQWREHMTSKKFQMKDGQIKDTLEPSQTKIYVKEK
jgi:1,4-alpha-glucan branching enzyme